MTEIVQLPPVDKLPAPLLALVDDYNDLSRRWSEASAEVLGAEAVEARADSADAAAVAAAVRTNSDFADYNTDHRGEAEKAHRRARHTAAALRRMLREATANLLDGLLAHRDSQRQALEPDVDAAAESYRLALLELRKARAQYRRTLAELEWWQDLSGRNLPTFTGYARRGTVSAVPDLQIADEDAGRLLSASPTPTERESA